MDGMITSVVDAQTAVDGAMPAATPMPPPDPVNIPAYFKDIIKLELEQKASMRRAEWVIKQHRMMRALVCGPDHDEAVRAEGGTDAKDYWDNDRSPTNPYDSALTAYIARLASPELRVRLLTKDAAIDPRANEKTKAVEALTNHQLEESDSAEEYEEALIDSLLCAQGVVWVGPLWGYNLMKAEGRTLDAGEICVVRVDPSDFASDPNSSNPKSDLWRNVRYRVRIDWAREKLEEMGIALNKPLEPIKSHETLDGTSRPGTDSVGNSDVEFTELRDWYFFGDKTYCCTTTADCSQFVVPWKPYDGPKTGPLKVLSFNRVGGLRYGRAPLMKILRLGETLDKVVGKVTDQALEAKTVIGVMEGSQYQDGVSITDAQNLAVVKTAGDPRAAMAIVKIDPIVQEMMPVIQMTQELIAAVSGDVYGSMGGQGETKTARQAVIKQNNAMTLFGKLRSRVVRWEKSIAGDVKYWSSRILAGMTEPMGVLTRQSGSLSSQVLELHGGPEFDPEQTNDEMLLELTTTAIPLADPMARLEQLLQLLSTALPAAMQVAQTGGNAGMVMRLVSDYSGIAEFAQIYGMQGPTVVTAAAQAVDAARPENKQAAAMSMRVPGALVPPMASAVPVAGVQRAPLPSNPAAGVPAMTTQQQGA